MTQENKRILDRQKESNSKKAGSSLKSTLYQDFLAERDEILRHKWLESEKAGKGGGIVYWSELKHPAFNDRDN